MKNDSSTVNKAKSSEARIPLSKHLEELRKRLIRIAIAAIIGTGVSFYFAKYIFDALESRAEGIDLIYIEMTEMMVTYFKVAIFGGIALAMPVIIYEIVKFIRPALKPKEKAYLYSLLPAVMLAFAAGVTFGFFILIPPAAHFLLTFGSNIATPQIRVENFVSLMLTLLFAIGIAFETPIVMFFLAKIGIVSAEGLMRHWRIAVIGAFVIGAAITPTFDPINQSLVSVPLIILYGVGIILAKFARRKKEAPVPVETSARA